MSRTNRKDFRGRTIRDGQYGRKSACSGCGWCFAGAYYKKVWNRKMRRKGISEND